MTVNQSSHGFVRALKGASDPPLAGFLYKIELARQAWDDASFHVPTKGEVIVDWIVTKLLKDKSVDQSKNPILDFRYWTLLFDILSSPDNLRNSSNSRPSDIWLTTLLTRIPIAPIIIATLTLIGNLEDQARKRIIASVAFPCLAILWPLGVQKISTEVLLECFGTFLDVLKKNCDTDTGLARVGVLITSSYRSSYSNSSNKKKLYITFLQNHLPLWLEYVLAETVSTPSQTLAENIYTAGVESLFNIDILRQSHDFKADNTLFQALRMVNKSTSICILPRLFASFLQYITKYRSTLFSQGSNQAPGVATDELRAAGMRFFASCQTLMAESEFFKDVWSIRGSLLSLVNQENLFNHQQLDMKHVLIQNVELSVAALAAHGEVDEFDILTHAVECLSTLARIDYDLVLPVIPRILPHLLVTVQTNQVLITFLDLLMTYHTKTRTMDTHIYRLFAVFLSHRLETSSGDARKVYLASISGALMHPIHLNHLSNAVHGFLTSGQTLTAVNFVMQALKDGWADFHNAERHTADDDGNTMDTHRASPETRAATFSLSTRLAAVILSSLPLQSITESIKMELRMIVTDLQTDFLQHMLAKNFKAMRKKEHAEIWPSQVVAAAALRLQYVLDTSRQLPLASHYNPKLSAKMMVLLEDRKLLPELRFEIFRTLLRESASGDLPNPEVAIGQIMEYINQNLLATKRDRKENALVALHMIIQKWLPIIDALASSEHMDMLMQILMSFDIGFEPHHAFMQVLQSAQFWELPNLRTACLARLNDATSPLDVNNNKDKKNNTTHEGLATAMATYRLLLQLPMEYFSKSSRADFLKKAINADMLISRLSENEIFTSSQRDHLITITRVFLKRIFLYFGFAEHLFYNTYEYLEHLLGCDNTHTEATGDYISVTLDLIEIFVLELCKTSEKTPDVVLAVLQSYLDSTIFGTSKPHSIRSQSFIRVVEVLTTQFLPTSFSNEIHLKIKDLYAHLTPMILLELSSIADDGFGVDKLDIQCELLSGWCCLLSLGTWLKTTENTFYPLGERFISNVMVLSMKLPASQSDTLNDIRVKTFSILMQELHYLSDSARLAHLDFIIAAYVSFARVASTNNREHIDAQVAKTWKTLSLSDVSHILDLASESLSATINSSADLIQLVHLATILLHDAPQNSSKHIHNFTAQCINAFSGHNVFTIGPLQLRLEVLECLAQYCSDRPAALRIVDLSGIWVVLSSFLSPSRAHDDSTSSKIFDKIITIISAVIRLRRDLVTLTLPHLGAILRQLFMSIRIPRPHLGSKQMAIVADTLPQWINIEQPLGLDEVKSLGRLLESLTTKSIVRNHLSLNDSHKPDSLAKPFSKHAAYVLQAYIEAMNDPLCILPSEIRKELQAGLYALCGMLNDHSRDAVMVSALDAGGKTTMKTLWKEYEKQRYIGKG